MKKIYLLATAAAILTGISVYLFASGLKADANLPDETTDASETKYEIEYVVAAAADIPANTKLTPELLTLAEIPKGSLVAGAVSDIGQLVGKTTKYPLIKGEQLFYYKAAELGDTDNDRLSDRIKSGYRAYTIYADEVTGLAGYLRIGDRVDIMVTVALPAENGAASGAASGAETSAQDAAGTSPEPASETFYFLTNMPIIAVGNASQYAGGATELNSYSSITLEVRVGDCTMFEYYILSGTVKVVLRGYGDEAEIGDASYPGQESRNYGKA